MSTITIDIRKINDSGIGRYISNLVPLIIDHFPEHKFNLLGNLQELRKFWWTQDNNITLIECNLKNYSITEQIGLLKLIPKDTDLYFSPHYNIPIFYPGKIITTVHDIAHIIRPEFSLLKKLYARLMLNAVKNKSEYIITVSDFTKKEFLNHFKLSNPDKIKVIHNGISESWLSVKKDKNPYHKPFLLYVGNVKPHKNLVNLLNAFETIQHKIPHNLVIVGKQEGFITGDPIVYQKASQFKDRVSFTGLIDDDILKQYYFYADALVFPTLYEGFGLPVLEAMSCGCPVIASNISPLVEISENSILYFDPYSHKDIANKILKLLSDDKLRRAQIEEGFKKVKKFAWTKTANNICQIFNQTL